MTNEQLTDIERRLSTHLNETWGHDSPYADISALIAEVRKLQAENAALREEVASLNYTLSYATISEDIL